MKHAVDADYTSTDRHVRTPECLVVIGANAGGPQALAQLLPRIPPSFPGAILVVQHTRPGFSRVLADQLSSLCQLPAYQPSDGQALQPATILIVPSGTSAQIRRPPGVQEPACEILLQEAASDPGKSAGRIDATMVSAARMMGPKTTGVLLTGLGEDGTEGMRAIADAGGRTIAQDSASSVVHEMAAHAIQAGAVSEILPLYEIADRIVNGTLGEVDADAA